MGPRNLISWQLRRELDSKANIGFARHNQVNDALLERLGLRNELEGHTGCVNCLHWNRKGDLLASGSDDCQIFIWKALEARKVSSFNSGHQGNIFSIKFLPGSNDCTIVTCAADNKVRVHDVPTAEQSLVCSCHKSRVKRLAIAPSESSTFWSCGEDGLIFQFDLREGHRCKNSFKGALLDMSSLVPNTSPEVKSIDLNPIRPELFAVGTDDAYARIFDRRMLSKATSKSSKSGRKPSIVSNFVSALESTSKLPTDSARYFIPGHLTAERFNSKKHSTPTCSGVQFSPNGAELLVTYNSEQIYLFDVLRASSSSNETFNVKDLSPEKLSNLENSTSSKGVSPFLKVFKAGDELPSGVNAMKTKANEYFKEKFIACALDLYNKALERCPRSAVLYGNRASVLMKRDWDGDLYAAVRDCVTAIKLDPEYHKMYIRLANVLCDLGWYDDAKEVTRMFKSKFDDHKDSQTVAALENDIDEAMELRANKITESRKRSLAREDKLDDNEVVWRARASDYSKRFCGHSNVATEKGANFFGKDGQYIMCGSDDGNIFFWDKSTSNLTYGLQGDLMVVNCLQPHPTFCTLATSGIDNVVRIWSPLPEDGRTNMRRVDNLGEASFSNQRRMRLNPLEAMLMNTGLGRSSSDEDEDDDSDGGVQCRTS